MPTPIPPLLVADDDPGDVFLLQRALQKARIDFPQHIVTNGEATISYLSGKGEFSDRNKFPMPRAVFLDLKMPCVSGFDVLEWMRSQPHLASIPVFVLTGSSIERDRQRALELGAKEYLIKPPTPSVLGGLLRPIA
jgi:CheY-like chemotaxis protein